MLPPWNCLAGKMKGCEVNFILWVHNFGQRKVGHELVDELVDGTVVALLIVLGEVGGIANEWLSRGI